jgi:hypothetical protein
MYAFWRIDSNFTLKLKNHNQHDITLINRQTLHKILILLSVYLYKTQDLNSNSSCDTDFLRRKTSQALVAHACNPSYSEGGDQEDHGSNPAWANSSRDPILKNT